MTTTDIRTLCTEELTSILPLVQQLSPDVTAEFLAECLTHILPAGAVSIGAFVDGELKGIAMFTERCQFWCGRHLEMDTLVVDESCRSLGLGRALVQAVEAEAAQRGIEMVLLKVYTTNLKARGFYAACGYMEPGTICLKPLPGHEEKWIKTLQKRQELLA